MAQSQKKPFMSPQQAEAFGGWLVIVVLKGLRYLVVLTVAGVVMTLWPGTTPVVVMLLTGALIYKMIMWRVSRKRLDRTPRHIRRVDGR